MDGTCIAEVIRLVEVVVTLAKSALVWSLMMAVTGSLAFAVEEAAKPLSLVQRCSKSMSLSGPTFQANLVEPGLGEEASYPWSTSMFVIEGRATLKVLGSKVDLRPGVYVYIPPHAHHSIIQKETPGLKVLHYQNIGRQAQRIDDQPSAAGEREAGVLVVDSNRLDFMQWEREPLEYKRIIGGKGIEQRDQIFGMARIFPDHELRNHSHELAEGYTVLKGRGVIFLSGEPKKVQPGSNVYIEGNQPHRLLNDGEEPLVILYYFKGKVYEDEVQYQFIPGGR